MEKIIHQIWVGEYEMPNKEKYFLERCKKINPDFIHILWTNENLPILPEKVQAHCDYFTAKKDYAFVADVLRVYLIHEYGGLYIDLDTRPNGSIKMTECFLWRAFFTTFHSLSMFISFSVSCIKSFFMVRMVYLSTTSPMLTSIFMG